MSPEECIDIMEALSLSFKRASNEGVSNQQKFKFKHILTQIELHIISMRKSVKEMLPVKVGPPTNIPSEN